MAGPQCGDASDAIGCAPWLVMIVLAVLALVGRRTRE